MFKCNLNGINYVVNKFMLKSLKQLINDNLNYQ